MDKPCWIEVNCLQSIRRQIAVTSFDKDDRLLQRIVEEVKEIGVDQTYVLVLARPPARACQISKAKQWFSS